MLSQRQNFLETINGGTPDRFVKQHEAFANVIGHDPLTACYQLMCDYGEEFVDAWGVTNRWAIGTPGPFPMHDDEHRVLKDICQWREIVKAPCLDFEQKVWNDLADYVQSIDRNEKLLMLTYLPGIFEEMHYLMGMEDIFVAFYEEPDEVRGLIDFLTEFELAYLKKVFDHEQFDVFFQDDDWGSAISTFLSPDMMREFFLEPYQRIYGYVKSRGVKTVVHHSDSYAATLVPLMIDMGIDVWQGCMSNNNIPQLIEAYGDKISFMGGIDNAAVDIEGWTTELVNSEVERICTSCGTSHFIPSLIQAGPFSTYQGVYEAVNDAIDTMSAQMF